MIAYRLGRTAALLIAMSLAATACSKTEDARLTESDHATEAANGNKAPKGDFARDYRGKIGDKSEVGMHLERSGDAISGTYFYASIGADLSLHGKIGGQKITLDESIGSKKTGAFELAFTDSGGLAGQWKSPDGKRVLPVELSEGHIERKRAPAQAAVDEVPKGTPIKPVAAAELAEFKDRYAKALASGAVKVPLWDDQVVYLADINNDGDEDYVVTSEGQGTMRLDYLSGVFAKDGDGLRLIEVPSEIPSYFAEDFLTKTDQGTLLNFRRILLDPHGGTMTGATYTGNCLVQGETRQVWKWSGKTMNVVFKKTIQSDCAKKK